MFKVTTFIKNTLGSEKANAFSAVHFLISAHSLMCYRGWLDSISRSSTCFELAFAASNSFSDREEIIVGSTLVRSTCISLESIGRSS